MTRAAFFLTLALAATSFADVPPANTIGCNGKKAGDACQTDDKKSGGCKSSTCSRLDYSQGTPPKSVEYACLTCDPASKPAGCSSAPLGAFSLAALVTLLRRR